MESENDMVLSTLSRLLGEARSCPRHVDYPPWNSYVLTPPPLCGECLSLKWEWVWSKDDGWSITRDKNWLDGP